MKRIITFVLAMLSCICMAQEPETIMFIDTMQLVGSSASITNTTKVPWKPTLQWAYTNAATPDIWGAYVVKKIDVPAYQETAVVTNPFGNVETNYLHAITNVTYVYITNVISADVTVSNVIESGDTHYLWPEDVLVVTNSFTNGGWMTVVGRRW